MDLGIIVTAVTLGALIFSALILIFGTLAGFLRGFVKSLIRTITVISSVIVALLIARPVAGLFSSMLEGIIKSALSKEGAVGELITTSPTLAALISGLPIALLTPIVFVVLFLLLSGILYIVYKIVSKILFSKRSFTMKSSLSRLLGTAIGFVGSLIIIVALLMPIVGYVRFADETLTLAEKSGIVSSGNKDDMEYGEDAVNNDNDSLSKIRSDVISPIADNAYISILGKLSKGAFNYLITFDLHGESVNIKKETVYVLDLYDKSIKPLSVGLKNYGEEQAAAVKELALGINDSVLVPSIICEIIPTAATKWNNGDEFIGIKSIATSVPEDLRSSVTTLLSILSTMTRDTIQSDLETVAEIFSVLARNGAFELFAGDTQSESLIDMFKNEAIISDLLAALGGNDRFKPLIKDITNLGLKAVAGALGLPADDAEVYKDLMDEIAGAMNDTATADTAEEKLSLTKAALSDIFKSYGFDASEKDTETIAGCLLSDLAGKGDLTGEDIESYFKENGLEDASRSNEQTDNQDESDLSFDRDEYKMSDESRAKLASTNVARMLAGILPFEHTKITLEKLMITDEILKGMSAEDLAKDGRLIAAAMADITKFYKSLTEKESIGSISDIASLDTSALASAVKNLNDSSLLSGVSAPLVSGTLQSMDLGISTEAIKKLEEGIAADKTGGEKEGYTESALDSFVSMSTLADKLASGGASADKTESDEDFAAAVEDVFKSMSPDSADLMASAVTPDLVKKSMSSISDQNAEKVSTIMGKLFVNMGSTSDMTDEEYKNEADALSLLFGVALDAEESNASQLFPTLDENGNTVAEGKVGISADELVSTVLNTTAACNTVTEAVGELGHDPFGLSSVITEENTDEFERALENSLTAENENTVKALASFFGANITIINGSVTITK